MEWRNDKELKEQIENTKRAVKRIILGVLIGIAIMILFFGSWFVVPAGHQGVVFNSFTGVKQVTYGEGMHLKVPIFETPYKIEVRTKVYNEDAAAASNDLQIVSTKVALNYHIDKEQVYSLFKNIGMDYEVRIINPSIQEIVKSVAAKHIAEDLIKNREIVKEEIKQAIKERLAKSYIIVDDMSITNFDFSDEFNKAIEAKVSAEQNALKEENNLKVEEFKAQQKVIQAEGEAQAIEIINKQLLQSPQYIDYLTIQKWDGKMPMALGSGSLLSITGNK